MKRDSKNSNLKNTLNKEFIRDVYESLTDEYISEEELQLTALENEQGLSEKEKIELKSRIKKSVQSQKSRTIIYRWSSVAAAVIFVVSSFFVFQNLSSYNIIEYANNFENTPTDGNTHLFLGLDDEVSIISEESEIQHLQNSAEIRIDLEEKVEQKLELTKTIYNTIYVPHGKRTKIVLADNSTIWLNSGSKFIYPAKFSKEKREVFLEGEAVFEVAKNKEKPFFVITNDVQVKVLGTVFNVSAYPNDKFTSTALESGAVEINYNKSLFKTNTLNITPGTVAVFNRDNESMTEHKDDVEKYTSWRYGILMLEAEPLFSIANKLSRFHDLEIEIRDKELAKETFSGRLEYNQSAEQTLRTISEIVDFELDIKDNKITIYKN